MGHINHNWKAEEVEILPEVEVRNWRNAGKFRLYPIRPDELHPDQSGGDFPPDGGFTNYGVVKDWFEDSPTYSDYGDSIWGTVDDYGEVKTP